MTKFWNVSVTLEDDRPEDTMTFVFADNRRASAVMRSYARAFPNYHSISVDPCDAWGRKYSCHAILCPVCGQPDDCGDCNHRPCTNAQCAWMGATLTPERKQP